METPGSGFSSFGILEGWQSSATPPGSAGDFGTRFGGVATLDPRLLSGKPPACSLADPKTDNPATRDSRGHPGSHSWLIGPPPQ